MAVTPDATFTRDARLKLGLSQEQFGKALGYSGNHIRGHIHKIETGKRPLPVQARKIIELMLEATVLRRG